MVSLWLLTGCELLQNTFGDIGPGEVKQEFVGTWIWNDYTRFTIVLNEDGTGTRGVPGDIEPFTWNVRGTTLRIDRTGFVPLHEVRNEHWDFVLAGDSLRLHSLQSFDLRYYYTNANVLGNIEPALFGTWAWQDGIQWVYEFNEDGTGTVGWTGEAIEFRWGVVNDVIRIELIGGIPADNFRHQRWAFWLYEDTLRLACRNVADSMHVYYYIRDGGLGPICETLLGTWLWEYDFSWAYIFNEDGTGTSGFYDYYSYFTWGISGDVLRILYWGSAIESWYFTIIDDVLRLQHRHLPDSTFYHIRETFEEDQDFMVS